MVSLRLVSLNQLAYERAGFVSVDGQLLSMQCLLTDFRHDDGILLY